MYLISEREISNFLEDHWTGDLQGFMQGLAASGFLNNKQFRNHLIKQDFDLMIQGDMPFYEAYEKLSNDYNITIRQVRNIIAY